MNSQARSFLIELLNYFRLHFVFGAVVPYSDRSVTGAGGSYFFFEADVHAEDRVGVEGADEVVVMGVIRRPF